MATHDIICMLTLDLLVLLLLLLNVLLLLLQGHTGVVQQLLAAGAQVDLLRDEAATALHIAAGLGRE
jgi:hypothetical protein